MDFTDVRSRIAAVPNIRHGKGASERELKDLVATWGPLPLDFKQYLEEFGWIAFDSYELYGLGPDVPSHLNLLDRSSELWRGDGNYNLPRELLPFYESGGGWFYCLSKLRPGQSVVAWAQEYEDEGTAQPYDETYPTWSEWLSEHILPPG